MPLRRENEPRWGSRQHRNWAVPILALAATTFAAPFAGLALSGEVITVGDWTLAGPWCQVDDTPAVPGWAYAVEIIDGGRLIPVAPNPALGGSQTLIVPAKRSHARYVPGRIAWRFAGFTAIRR